MLRLITAGLYLREVNLKICKVAYIKLKWRLKGKCTTTFIHIFAYVACKPLSEPLKLRTALSELQEQIFNTFNFKTALMFT